MINSPLLILKNKIINGTRLMLVHKLPGIVPFFMVTEYPKSGGTWLGQLLSGYFNIQFPQNTFPKVGMSIVHGHYLPSGTSEKIKKIFWLVRDGRDVMVSSYYYFLIPNRENRQNPKDMKYYRSRLRFKDFENIRENLPEYIEFCFTHKPSLFNRFAFEGNWSSFNKKWHDYELKHEAEGNIMKISYESLLNDTGKELARMVRWVTDEKIDLKRIGEVVARYGFEAQSGRKPGIEDKNSFLRKGISGDWENKFSREAAEIFDHYAGEMLIEEGYEKNRAWTNRIV